MKSEKSAPEGMLVPCMMAGSDEWSTAEIIKIRSTPADPSSTSTAAATEGDDNNDNVDSSSSTSSDVKKLYYVHYVDFNKRLDCWVTEDRLDFSKARLKGQEAVEKETTKKEETSGGSGRCYSPTPSAIKDVSNLASSSSGMTGGRTEKRRTLPAFERVMIDDRWFHAWFDAISVKSSQRQLSSSHD